MKTVKVHWEWLEWKAGYNWHDNMCPQLKYHEWTEIDLRTCVYVIVVDGRFAIDYPNGVSPTIYIGSGNFKRRLAQHKTWLNEITSLVQDYRFSVAICQPKLRSGQPVHKDMEAALLHNFEKLHGCIPIRNQRIENEREEFNYLPKNEFKKPLIIGKGYRYHWAIRPLKSNRYYRSFSARSNAIT